MLCKEITNAFGEPAGFSGTFGLFFFPGDRCTNPAELGQHWGNIGVYVHIEISCIQGQSFGAIQLSENVDVVRNARL